MTELEIIRNSEDFNQSLLFNKQHERGTDIEVIFNEQRALLHSIVLGGNSSYFDVHLFSTPIVPKVITFENINTEATESIIEYCYSEKINLLQVDVVHTLEAAHFLMMQPVIDGCCEALISMLDSKNCIKIWKLAQKLRLIHLEIRAFDYIQTAFNGITKDFLTMDLRQLLGIVKSNASNCARDKNITLTLIKEWIIYDPKVRKVNFENLLKHIHRKPSPLNTLASQSENTCIETTDLELVVLGGSTDDESKTVETYDTHSNSWRQRDVQLNKTHFSCQFYDQKIFVISGDDPNSMECYDVETWQKTPLAPMHTSRSFFATVIAGGYIYVIGGFDDDSLSCIERYNIKENQWTRLNSMPTARDILKAAVVDGEIFAVGGAVNFHSMDVNECYNITTGNWRSCKPMQEKRRGFGIAEMHGFVYVAGGTNELVEYSSVERYDPKIDRWTFIEPLSFGRQDVALVNFCGTLIISGGYTYDNDAIDTVERYNPQTNQWSTLPSLNKSRQLHNMIVVPRHLLD